MGLKKDYLQLTNLFTLLVLIINSSNQSRFTSNALSVVTTNSKVAVPKNESSQVGTLTDFKPFLQSSKSPSTIRIRSTVDDDLPTVIDLLTSEIIAPLQQAGEPTKVSQFRPALFGNWNASMKKVKAEASFTSQLTHRLAAMSHATKVLSTSSGVDDIGNEEQRYLLWGNDTFRAKVETAVRHTSACQGTIWDDWNFAITPDDQMLHHFMLSATDDEFLDQVVGFCEVGICEVPSEIEGFQHQLEPNIIPCIGNLVVSPNHRRRGVGKKLVTSVIRLLKTHQKKVYNNPQNHHKYQLGLFVDEKNKSGIRLYEKAGFSIAGKCTQDASEKIFMVHELK